ncbi:uncharacterized protein LOC143213514 [Lasioglossum baleicum]|uniref:uncharacterized protein LOC143213514 n=1 Tax=Lasioglossum baleicum TaxID=434251 RepID=UPI003FCCF697
MYMNHPYFAAATSTLASFEKLIDRWEGENDRRCFDEVSECELVARRHTLSHDWGSDAGKMVPRKRFFSSLVERSIDIRVVCLAVSQRGGTEREDEGCAKECK